MAKRHPNDRNEVAVNKAKASRDDERGVFILSTDIEIELRTVNFIEINDISESVPLPPKPTYETRTSRGRVEHYPLDDKVVEQSPEYADVWRQWKIDFSNALREQSRRTTRAMFLDGTVIPEDWYDAKWERRMRLIGYTLPEDEEERWLLYLETGISKEEAAELVLAIMRRTTLPEEVIQAAEETFRDSVRSIEGSGHMEVAPADTQ